MDQARQHKDIRLSPENYLGCRWYFVTVCTYDRVKYFRGKAFCDWVLRVLKEESAKQFFLVRAFCLMPDHLHLLLQGGSLHADLLKFINGFKQRTSYGFWARRKETLWQVSFYDHILRDKDAPSGVAWYIWLNPVRAGLAKKAEDYLYSGPFARNWDAGEAPEKVWAPPKIRK